MENSNNDSLDINKQFNVYFEKRGYEDGHTGYKQKEVMHEAFFAGFASAFHLFTNVIGGEGKTVAMARIQDLLDQLNDSGY